MNTLGKHNEAHPHICPLCQRHFAYADTLAFHVATLHPRAVSAAVTQFAALVQRAAEAEREKREVTQ